MPLLCTLSQQEDCQSWTVDEPDLEIKQGFVSQDSHNHCGDGSRAFIGFRV